jgi:hypothetical protein
MEEYISNIDFLNVLDYFAYDPPDDSYPLSFSYLLDHHPFPHALTLTLPELTDKAELPTTAASTEENGPRADLAVVGEVSQTGGLEFQWEVREKCG